MSDRAGDVVIYETGDGLTRIDVALDGETVWLTQSQIAELFGVNTQAVSKHLTNIFDTEELDEVSTCSKTEEVRQEGSRTVRRQVAVYNLDAAISGGYRANSRRATHFRRWAIETLTTSIGCDGRG